MKYLRQSVTGMCASWWILSIAVVAYFNLRLYAEMYCVFPIDGDGSG